MSGFTQRAKRFPQLAELLDQRARPKLSAPQSAAVMKATLVGLFGPGRSSDG